MLVCFRFRRERTVTEALSNTVVALVHRNAAMRRDVHVYVVHERPARVFGRNERSIDPLGEKVIYPDVDGTREKPLHLAEISGSIPEPVVRPSVQSVSSHLKRAPEYYISDLIRRDSFHRGTVRAPRSTSAVFSVSSFRSFGIFPTVQRR